MTVLRLNGKPVDYRHPPEPTDMVLWSVKTTGGKACKGSFRTIAHMDRLNELAVKRFGKPIQVIQSDWNTGVPASAGTHDKDSVWDVWIPGVDPWVQQRFFRANGFACWYRHPPLFGYHIHGFTLPWPEGKLRSDDWKVHGFQVGLYVDGGWSTRGSEVSSSQIADYYNHAFGLSGQHAANSDRSWYPDDIDATVFDLGKFVANRLRRQLKAA